jgi:glycosyltransferase involved in cell wall biosynthesis
MRILIIRKDAIALIPPLLSVANILADLGHDVHIITSEVSDSIAKQLSQKGITYEIINRTGKKHFIGKVYQYLMFRKDANKALKRASFDLLWVEDAHTILSLGTTILNYKYILQISELHNTDNRLLKAINKVIHESQAVFIPEYNRCILYQNWFKLATRPTLLPNKPYFLPNRDEIEKIKIKYNSIINQIRDKKIILYQGRIHPERLIDGFVSASKKLGDDWRFVIMGSDGFGLVEHYKTLNEKLIHIDFIPAPDYLAITSMARIGILSYDPMTLNTAYCAPNKIYEYGAYGIPMVGNNIPGLKILEEKQCGIIVDENDTESILNAYYTIDNDYENFSKCSLRQFDSTDNVSIIKNVLDHIKL